jgi:predicted hydrocarbon binding protein
VSSAAGSPMLSSRLAQLFVESTIQEVGADKLSAILADDHLSPSILARTPHGKLDGAEAARLYASIQHALRLFYGRGAHGILMRIGANMWTGMASQVAFLEKAELEIARRLPVPARRRRMLNLVAGYLREGGGAASVHTLDLDLLLVDQSAAATTGQTSAEPICFVTLGLIQGALLWATGHEVDLEEITCKAAGAPACEFKVKFGGKGTSE